MSVVGGNPQVGLIKHQTMSGKSTWWTLQGRPLRDVSALPSISIKHPPLASTSIPTSGKQPSAAWIAAHPKVAVPYVAKTRFTLEEFPSASNTAKTSA